MDKRTRRVKGNSTPPEDDLPISYWIPDEPDEQPDPGQDVIEFLLAFALIIACIVVIMYAFGRFA